jgi:cytochrome c peroxidase
MLTKTLLKNTRISSTVINTFSKTNFSNTSISNNNLISNLNTTSKLSQTKVTNNQNYTNNSIQNEAYSNYYKEQTSNNWGKALIIGTATAVAVLSTYQNINAETANWKQVRQEIVDLLDSKESQEYEDGSYGPILVRLAWHASGTYDCLNPNVVKGGSNGATMRFCPESAHGANAGLIIARDILEPIKQRHPEISYADLWTLAGCVAIEELGGPHIEWKAGRTDAPSGKSCPPDGRLPDAARGADHIRAIFYRMGFNDRETVALIGCHVLGRCHTSRSGFDGPWTRSPITFSNDFFVQLKEVNWSERTWNGPRQFQDPNDEIMMLPTDIALIEDPEFKKYVDLYAADEEAFFKDFASAFKKLMELGVFDSGKCCGNSHPLVSKLFD